MRLARRFVFSDSLLRHIGRFIPYYQTNVGVVDPASIASLFLKHLDDLRVSLEGKTILEIGCGQTMAVGYALAASRGCNVIGYEPYVPFNPALDTRLKATLFCQSLSSAPTVRWTSDLGSISPTSIDIVVSNSVLEHVTDVDCLLADLDPLLVPEAIHLHQIDYRDHFFKYPYEFLTFNQRIWNRWLNPGDLPRLRLDDHIARFHTAGWEVSIRERDEDPTAFQRVESRLHPDFASRSALAQRTTRALLSAHRASAHSDSSKAQ